MVIDRLKEQGVIKDYAIGGAIAAIFYIEPVLTHDLDIFIVPAEGEENILIENIPDQFLPAFNPLIEEAVKEADQIQYKSVETRLIKAEYLIAIMLRTYRPKDRERLVKFLDKPVINKELLDRLLETHQLKEKYNKLVRFYNDG